MKKHLLNKLNDEEVQALCRRPKMDFEAVFSEVKPIIEAVRQEGDAALKRFTKQFDGVEPDPLVVDPADFNPQPDEEIRQAIETAFNNIYRFHMAQLPMPLEVETMPGIRCMRVPRAIESVGLYVPGGTAMLPSTLMMLGIPAALAGCRDIIIATPPALDGSVPEEILYIAQKVGARAIVRAGGAQAVAAMAWGTGSVPKTDKIFGPGNQYVTAAKMLLQNSEAQVAIDMPAGPSEVLVIADETAEPSFVAADLLSQAEHGADSQAVLVATPAFGWDKCLGEIDRQLSELPRSEVAAKAMEHSFGLEVSSLDDAFAFSNRYAPEHLIVQCEEAASWTDSIRHAGSVFLGKWSPESAGDYASGTNHTLPTYGYARMYGGVSVESFYRYMTMQQLSREGLEAIAPSVEKLAEIEGLEGHKRAVSIRINQNRTDEK